MIVLYSDYFLHNLIKVQIYSSIWHCIRSRGGSRFWSGGGRNGILGGFPRASRENDAYRIISPCSSVYKRTIWLPMHPEVFFPPPYPPPFMALFLDPPLTWSAKSFIAGFTQDRSGALWTPFFQTENTLHGEIGSGLHISRSHENHWSYLCVKLRAPRGPL